MTLDEINNVVVEEAEAGMVTGDQRLNEWPEPWMIVTGGEPALQLDREFCDYFHKRGWKIAVETNGSMLLPWDDLCGEVGCEGVCESPDVGNCPADDYHGHAGWVHVRPLERFYVDWITVSPKVAEHAIKQRWAHEVKYVRGTGQAIPKTVVEARHKLISPAFDGLELDRRSLAWCVDLVKKNPEWRLSPQLHKGWVVR
jgi:organic radical activating enzyme